MVGGPEDIRRLARRVALEAESVREVAAQVCATRSVPWQSPTASAFRDAVTVCVLSLHHTAELLDTAARVLLVHASAVQSVVDALPLVGGVVEPGGRRGGDR